MKTLFTALLLSIVSAAGVNAGVVRIHETREPEPGLRLDFTITYLNPLGHTIADGQGLHFYNDVLSAQWGLPSPLVTLDPTVLPSQYWGSYPLYYSGAEMDYMIKITNTGHHKFKNLTVVAIEEYLSPTGQVNTRIGLDAVRDWFIPKLEKGQSKTLFGSINIPVNADSGLDQTHIQVFRSRHGDDEREDDGERSEDRSHHHGQESASKLSRLIYENIQAGIWCPPASQPTKPL
jgi:hypothetical protein